MAVVRVITEERIQKSLNPINGKMKVTRNFLRISTRSHLPSDPPHDGGVIPVAGAKRWVTRW